MSMPFALSFMVPSLLGGGARADAIVRAIAAGLVLGRRLELPAPDAARRLRDRLAGLHQVEVGGRVAPDQPRFEEAQLHPRGQPARHFILRERVDLELE